MKPFDSPIYVTRPTLPPLQTFADGLREIWDSRWLTNNGPVLRRFEAKLQGFLHAENLSMFTNGALALMVAMQGLRLTGEVITTPFTFVATTNAITQCGMQPVFADIALEDLTLDPDRVEALITPRTSAILAVHVFGIPCQLERLGAIAAKHGLALIYDAAHAFGMTVNGKSIANFGDVTMFSFHATKLYHTIEGGALTFGDRTLGPVFDALCNHGLEPDGDVRLAGMNAKMSEVQALMGELMLDSLRGCIGHGHAIDAAYREHLKEVPGLSVLPEPLAGIEPNYSFFPVLVNEADFGMSSDELKAALLRYNVHVRRYFTPLISDMTAFRGAISSDSLANARRIGPQVMALPTYADLAIEDVHRICALITNIQRVDGGKARSRGRV